MAALAADRLTPKLDPAKIRRFPVKAAEVIYKGALVAIDANGDLVKGAAATGLTAVGVALTSTAEDPAFVTVERGTFRFANSAAADAITKVHIDDTVFIVDDQTVALTNGSSTRSAAGKVYLVETAGVWVTVG